MYKNVKGRLVIVDVGSMPFKSLKELDDLHNILKEKFR